MMAIVTEVGKFKYNCLLMGMRSPGDISQAKLYEMLGDIEDVKTYINNILVLSKESFSNHTEKLRIIFGRLRAAGLNKNATKCIFGVIVDSFPSVCNNIGRDKTLYEEITRDHGS